MTGPLISDGSQSNRDAAVAVKLARIEAKVDNLIQATDELKSAFSLSVRDNFSAHDAIFARLLKLDTGAATMTSEISDIKGDVQDLHQKDTIWGLISGTAAVVVASVVHYISTGKP